jgi:hypothetical protein
MSTYYEEEEEEELPTPQADEVYIINAVFIDLRSDRERQAYALIKDRVFVNTKYFDPILLEKTVMDSNFNSILQALGWEDSVPVQKVGSRSTTILFLYTLQGDLTSISFRFHGVSYQDSWKDLSRTLGFHRRCAISLEQACAGFNRESSCEEIFGHLVRGKLIHRCNDILHPTLFPRDDV